MPCIVLIPGNSVGVKDIMVYEIKNEKITFIPGFSYSKNSMTNFWSLSAEHFIKDKALFSEECKVRKIPVAWMWKMEE